MLSSAHMVPAKYHYSQSGSYGSNGAEVLLVNNLGVAEEKMPLACPPHHFSLVFKPSHPRPHALRRLECEGGVRRGEGGVVPLQLFWLTNK